MKKTLRLLSAIALTAILVPLLSSCDNEPPYPGGNPNREFLDQYLFGEWQLADVNGVPVGGYDVNWMEFDNDGDGTYYYYNRGRETEENFYWYCYSNGGYNYVHVDYQYMNDADMLYWFEDNGYTLCLQWYSAGQKITYRYSYTD